MNIEQGQGQEEGSALLITLLSTTIIGLMLASYLDLVSAQNRSVVRSERWNSSIPVLEAGVEEAMTHLFWNWTNMGTEGWALQDGAYVKEREVGDNRYVLSVSTKGAWAEIYAVAYVREALGTNYLSPPRSVRVTATNAPIFVKAMAADGYIDLSGNKILADSFNSTNSLYNTDGMYDPDKRKDGGDVATNSSLTDSLSVWNAEIYGKASTGPGGTVTIGSNGSVGSKEWVDSGKSGIEPNWASDDMNTYFREVKEPFSGGALTPVSATVDGETYTYVLTSGNWVLDSLKLSGKSEVLVTGDAVLYVKGDVSFSGQAGIVIESGANLNLFVAGASADMSGNGVVNRDGYAKNFHYWGLPSNTSISMRGNAGFTGVIYAPSAALTLGGGGNDALDFVGSVVVGSAKLNGHFSFHYDEALAADANYRGFVVETWNEVSFDKYWAWAEL